MLWGDPETAFIYCICTAELQSFRQQSVLLDLKRLAGLRKGKLAV